MNQSPHQTKQIKKAGGSFINEFYHSPKQVAVFFSILENNKRRLPSSFYECPNQTDHLLKGRRRPILPTNIGEINNHLQNIRKSNPAPVWDDDKIARVV